MAFSLNNIRELFKAPAAEQTPSPEDIVFGYIKQALDNARLQPANPGEVTLQDYQREAEKLGERIQKDNELRPEGQKIEWNVGVYSDLREHDLSGFTLSDPRKINPEIANAGHVEKGVDNQNLDGDNTVNAKAVAALYTEFCNRVRFGGSVENLIVDPASSFCDQIEVATTVNNVTFRNLGPEETFTFGAGQYTDIRLENVNGGKIAFSGQATNVHIDGTHGEIGIIGNGTVSNLTTGEHFSILKFDMGENTTLSHSKLGQATVSIASSCEKATWQDVEIDGGSLAGLSARGMTLTKVTINNTAVNGLDLSGAELNDVVVNNQPVTSPKQLQDLGITVDSKTTISVSPELMAQAKASELEETIAGIRAAAANWGEQMGKPVVSADQAQAASLGQDGAGLVIAMMRKVQPEETVGRTLSA